MNRDHEKIQFGQQQGNTPTPHEQQQGGNPNPGQQ